MTEKQPASTLAQSMRPFILHYGSHTIDALVEVLGEAESINVLKRCQATRGRTYEALKHLYCFVEADKIRTSVYILDLARNLMSYSPRRDVLRLIIYLGTRNQKYLMAASGSDKGGWTTTSTPEEIKVELRKARWYHDAMYHQINLLLNKVQSEAVINHFKYQFYSMQHWIIAEHPHLRRHCALEVRVLYARSIMMMTAVKALLGQNVALVIARASVAEAGRKEEAVKAKDLSEDNTGSELPEDVIFKCKTCFDL